MKKVNMRMRQFHTSLKKTTMKFFKVLVSAIVLSLVDDLLGQYDKIFMYRRPTLYPLEIAVDFLKSLLFGT